CPLRGRSSVFWFLVFFAFPLHGRSNSFENRREGATVKRKSEHRMIRCIVGWETLISEPENTLDNLGCHDRISKHLVLRRTTRRAEDSSRRDRTRGSDRFHI